MRKPGPVRELPPRLELECLKALWVIGEGNVKQVRDVLASDRDFAYTTVMTVLDRLARRGAVHRRKVGRSFVYVPALTRESVQRLAVQDLVDVFFEGKHELLRTYLGAHPAEPLTLAAAAASDAPGLRLDTSLL